MSEHEAKMITEVLSSLGRYEDLDNSVLLCRVSSLECDSMGVMYMEAMWDAKAAAGCGDCKRRVSA